LRWLRFLAAVDVPWNRAERRDVRDFVLWLKAADNPQRRRTRADAPLPGSVNQVTGKRTLSVGYAPALGRRVLVGDADPAERRGGLLELVDGHAEGETGDAVRRI